MFVTKPNPARDSTKQKTDIATLTTCAGRSMSQEAISRDTMPLESLANAAANRVALRKSYVGTSARLLEVGMFCPLQTPRREATPLLTLSAGLTPN